MSSHDMGFLASWALIGLIAGIISSHKGRNLVVWWIIGMLMPVLGILLAAALPADKAALEIQQIKSGKLIKCPACAETIRPDATICRHCQRVMDRKISVGQTHQGDILNNIRKNALLLIVAACIVLAYAIWIAGVYIRDHFPNTPGSMYGNLLESSSIS